MGKTTSKCSTHPLMERLEGRQLLSVSLHDKSLVVKGTQGRDAIHFQYSKSHSSFTVNLNGKKSDFLLSAVDTVTVLGGPGADQIVVDHELSEDVTVYGGPDKDHVRGATDRVGVRKVAQNVADHAVDAVTTSHDAPTATDPGGHVATGVMPLGEPVPTAPGRSTPGDELRTPPVPLAAPPIPTPNPGGGGTPTGGTTDPGGGTTTGDPSDPGTGGTGSGGGGTSPDDGQTPVPTPFQVFDSTLFNNRPNSNPLGAPRIILTGNVFKSVGGTLDESKPDEATVRGFARLADDRQQLLVIDIETWPIDVRGQTDADVQHTIDMFIQICDWAHNERPNLKIGFYGVLPLQDYWTPVSYDKALHGVTPWWTEHLPQFTANFKAWQAANDRLDVLASKVDFLAPSLYSFYDDQDGWQRYAKWNIEEAKQYGKPIYPFLWMEYHDSTAQAGQLLPVDYWNMELQTLKQSVDGVVIWGGANEQWNPQAPWVQATEQFIATLN